MRGLTPIDSGLVFLTASVAIGVGGPLSGRLAARVRPELVMALGLAVGGIGVLGIATSPDWWLDVLWFVVMGAGLGLAWAFASVGTQTVVEPARAGEASGVTLTLVIGVAGLAIVGAATAIEELSAGGGRVLEQSAIDDVLRVFAGVALAAAGTLLAASARARRRPPVAASHEASPADRGRRHSPVTPPG